MITDKLPNPETSYYSVGQILRLWRDVKTDKLIRHVAGEDFSKRNKNLKLVAFEKRQREDQSCYWAQIKA